MPQSVKLQLYCPKEAEITRRPPIMSSTDGSPWPGYTTPMILASLLLSSAAWSESIMNATGFVFRGTRAGSRSFWPSMAIALDPKALCDVVGWRLACTGTGPFLMTPTGFLSSNLPTFPPRDFNLSRITEHSAILHPKTLQYRHQMNGQSSL